jgi:nitroreductase
MTVAHPDTQHFAPTAATAHAAVTPEGLVAALRWRYAVKKFEPGKPIPDPIWNALEEALTLSASSYGLQPWKFFVIDDPALRAQLRPAAFGQSQVTDAARFVVFAVRKDFSIGDIVRYVERVAEVRKVPLESLEGFKNMMAGLLRRTPEQRESWAGHQVYIALGNFLTSAAALGVDACPMEGLDAAQYDRILGLSETGYQTLFAVAAGYRSGDDAYAAAPKVRFPKEEVMAHL